MGTKLLIAVLLALLAGAVYVAYVAMTGGDDPDMPADAYFALALGVGFSLVIGCGLMALVFYSSRHGYDDAADGRGSRPSE